MPADASDAKLCIKTHSELGMYTLYNEIARFTIFLLLFYYAYTAGSYVEQMLASIRELISCETKNVLIVSQTLRSVYRLIDCVLLSA
jgi:hypothetical protein